MQAGDRMFKTRGTRDRCPASTLTVDASASLPAAPRRLPSPECSSRCSPYSQEPSVC